MTTHFSLEEQLDSCKVTKTLILSIEDHLKKIFDRYIKDDILEHYRQPIKIRIQDSIGLESIESIARYSPHRFPDDVKSIRIELVAASNNDNTRIEVKITFNENDYLSKLDIDCTSDNAREIAIGIRDGVRRCLAAAKTNHSIYHISSFWHGALGVLLPLSFLILFGAVIKNEIKLMQYAAIALTILFFILKIAPKYRPYITFDSAISDKRDSDWKFWIGGTLTFLIFEVLAHRIIDYLK